MQVGKQFCEAGSLTGATLAAGPTRFQSSGVGRLNSTSRLDLRECYKCIDVAIPESSVLGKFHLESYILQRSLPFTDPAKVKCPLDLSTLLVFSTQLNFMESSEGSSSYRVSFLQFSHEC